MEIKRETKRTIANIKKEATEFVESSKNANKLLSVQESANSENKEVSTAAVRCLQNMLVHVLKKRVMVVSKTDSEADEKYKKWLSERYQEIIDGRLNGLASEDSSVFETSLTFLMTIMKHESLYPVKSAEDEGFYFPLGLLNEILKKILSPSEDRHEFILRFQEFLEYNDIKYYVLRSLSDLLKEMLSENYEPSEVFMKNLLGLLQFIHVPPIHGKKKPDDEEESKVFCEDEDQEKPKFELKMNLLRKYFSNVWLQILKFKLTVGMYKSLLVVIPEKVMPSIDRPLLLADFFLESYDKGGPISLLALNGVFQLIQKFNLEYPDFYKKFYSLFEPGIFHAKYRARFFYLADIFMSSTHLSEYLAAAFAKRTARLCLKAPPTGIRIALQFIGNLMHRHPGLKMMMHDPENQTDFESDPYVMTEEDPAKSNAMKSSLWEIKTLHNHVIPKIAQESKFIDRDLPKLEWAIGEVLENSLDEKDRSTDNSKNY